MKHFIIVRGGGDLASGTIFKLSRCGYPVLVLEAEHPTSIRRQVSFSEAIYEGEAVVEGIRAVCAHDFQEAEALVRAGQLTIMKDPKGEAIEALRPDILIDAILAKRNCGTTKDMAPLTIGLGPGFTAGEDVDVVVETKRGHDLGRLIYQGCPKADTGVPGNIGGFSKERVIYAPAGGKIRHISRIGEIVTAGEDIALIETDGGMQVPVKASISGILRGLIRNWYPVKAGLKIADIDPRIGELNNCFTISDKARCIAGGVLEAVLRWELQNADRRNTF